MMMSPRSPAIARARRASRAPIERDAALGQGQILWHRGAMKWRAEAVLAVAIVSSGCFQMTTVMKVKGDGSGTIDHRMLFTKQALAQLKQFAALGGGRQAIDPTSEQQAQEMAAALGPGVSYVSSQPVSTPMGEGRDAIYAFTDVSQLRISTQPPPPGGAAIQAGGLSTVGDTLTFSFTHAPNGTAVVHINVPESSLV